MDAKPQVFVDENGNWTCPICNKARVREKCDKDFTIFCSKCGETFRTTTIKDDAVQSLAEYVAGQTEQTVADELTKRIQKRRAEKKQLVEVINE